MSGRPKVLTARGGGGVPPPPPPPGFRRKEFRGKLAIAITANFINRNTTAEAKVEEISGVAFIFNQKFFQDLREATGLQQLYSPLLFV